MEVYGAMGHVIGEGRALFYLGNLYEAIGDRENSSAYFNKAKSKFEAIGARFDMDLTSKSLSSIQEFKE
jgi:hypothetical protein